MLLVIVGGLWSCRSAVVPGPPRRVPDPLALPANAPALSEVARAAARRAVAAAENGDFGAAWKHAAQIPRTHPVGTLVDLEIRFLKTESVFPESLELARRQAGWAAAWTLAALAGKQAGVHLEALEAARHAAELEPDARGAADLVTELEQSVVTIGTAEAQALLARGDADAALAAAERTLEAVPSSSNARIAAATAALAAGHNERAAALLPALPDTPAGLAVKGRVAEALRQWDLAVEFYGRLPATYPERCALLGGARQNLRLTNAPPYVTRSLTSEPLTRRGLAALLVWEIPALAGLAQGPVPVYEDIVDIPERADIVTVARAGVLTGDPVARRFGAGRVVTQRELMATFDRLAAALGVRPPVWCDQPGGREAEECVRTASPIRGADVAALLRRITGAGGEECR